MQVTPLYDKVIIKRAEEVKKSLGGIFIPEVASTKPVIGTVLAVGEGRLLVSGEVKPLIVKVGDQVIFPTHLGTEVTIDNELVLVMSENDILGIIDQE